MPRASATSSSVGMKRAILFVSVGLRRARMYSGFGSAFLGSSSFLMLVDYSGKRVWFPLCDGCVGDADELRFFGKFLKRARPRVAHAYLHAGYKSRDHV